MNKKFLPVLFLCVAAILILLYIADNGSQIIYINGKDFAFDLSKGRNFRINSSQLNANSDWKTAFDEIANDLKANRFEVECKHKIRRGNWFDCNTAPFKLQKPCLIYSFGINHQWTFDDAVAALDCEVHSFDPSMGINIEFTKGNGVKFHPFGLSDTSDKNFAPRVDVYVTKNPKQRWDMRTLKDISDHLGHNKSFFDIVKIDIESYEWNVLHNLLQDNILSRIRQLDIEFHIFPDTPEIHIVKYLKIYQLLKEAGFRRYAGGLVEYNPKSQTKLLQADCGFVNLKFDFGHFPYNNYTSVF